MSVSYLLFLLLKFTVL